MAHDALGGEDAAWLHMEHATNPMVVSAMVELAEPLPLERAYGVLQHLARIPRFKARISRASLRIRRPSWEPASDFDLTQHIEHVTLESSAETAVRDFIGRAVRRPLAPNRPLWHVSLIDRPGAGTTILFRVHHALADGFALLGVLHSLCDSGVPVHPRAATVSRRARSRAILGAAKALGRLVALPADPATLLRGPLGTDKRVAWSQPVAVADLKRTARVATATVNDVLVALTAGALRRYLARRGEDTAGLELHAMVPVNLRTSRAPATLGNRFGLVVLGLPVAVSDPLVRVTAVKQRMELIKETPEAVVGQGLLRAMGRAPRAVESLAVNFFGKKTSLVLTNVPGPRAPLKLAGIGVSRVMFWVPQSGQMGLGISLLSYAGMVTFGVLSDAARVPDPERLVADFSAELAALEASVRAESRAARGVAEAPSQGS